MTEFVLSIFIFLLIQMAVCQPSIYNNQKIETRTIDEKSISRAMGRTIFGVYGTCIMKRMFKQWWSTMSTKRMITSHLNLLNIKKNSMTYKTLEIQFLFWDGHKHVAGLNRLIRSQWTLLGNWISYGITYIFYINKQ